MHKSNQSQYKRQNSGASDSDNPSDNEISQNATSAPGTSKPSDTEPPKVEQDKFSRLKLFLNFNWKLYLFTILVFEVAFLLLFGYTTSLLKEPVSTILLILVVWLIISILHITVLLLARVFERIWQKRTIEKDINSLQAQLETGDFFTTLIRINFRYIDKYYLQTQVQADKSFYLSAIGAVVSLLLILSGVAMLFFSKDPNTVTAATVTTAAGVLGEFIATVFFYLYNKTVSEMSKYHQKLVLTQNISLALKMAEQLPETVKSEAQVKLIECLSKDINMYLCMQVMNTAGDGLTHANGSKKAAS